jgi:hypothetical protein
VFRTAPQHGQPKQGGDAASNEHPNGFVGWRSGKEPGHIRGEGVSGVKSDDDEYNSTNEQGQSNEFIHKYFFVQFGLMTNCRQPQIFPSNTRTSKMTATKPSPLLG